jgi:hypothetical protein
MSIEKSNSENTLQYYKRIRDGVVSGMYDFERSEIYGLLFPTYDAVSADTARKALRALDLALEADENRDTALHDSGKSEPLGSEDNDGFYSRLLEQKKNTQAKDYKSYVNQQAREIARIDSLKEISSSLAKEFNAALPFTHSSPYHITGSNKSAIILLSDWHFGIEIDNFLNKFDGDVFLSRISQLTEKVINNIKFYEVEKLYVVNLNDLISGVIHSVLRLQNRENLMQQIMVVSEVLAEMLVEFSEYADVEYYSTTDNHSRAIADKKQSLDKENFCVLIDWFLCERLKNANVKCCENEFDNEVCTFNIYGWNYLGVHGDKDKISNVVQNLSLMTKRFYDVVFTAHFHHSQSDEIHSTYVIANGALSGTDNHSKNLRKSSNPSQTMVIVSEEDPLESVCILKLN